MISLRPTQHTNLCKHITKLTNHEPEVIHGPRSKFFARSKRAPNGERPGMRHGHGAWGAEDAKPKEHNT